MARSRNVQVAQSVNDGVDDLQIKFYIDRSSDTPVPRVELYFTLNSGGSVTINKPLSDITNLSGAQKNNLRNLLTTIRDQVLSLEGFG